MNVGSVVEEPQQALAMPRKELKCVTNPRAAS
ncbi:hypothetical protein AB7M56_005728 [Bradyrhizobium elkanii]|jgi:hypothetical protein|nr:hypothetical protein [Bradyrhizobium elkanii]MCS3451960.1 hypothetical protein [Bradyrhizobium elkanii]MCS3518896.1 hypothetical protein [Bradyrhizobium elkanii]MCS3565941.1 hypothetical protein [Bradyrhizobium elkanii]MCS4075454.1 hypothetical protein [Bradyrhizobium elkanii]